MLERKLYKTKLCILYQRGRCARQSCSFAHGDAELRRFSGSVNGRRDYRGNDLREKLSRYSPRKYSPGRDGRFRHSFRGQNKFPSDQGYSPSKSSGKRSKRRHRKHLEDESDASGDQKISDGVHERTRERKFSSHGNKNIEEQLRQTQLDIDMFDDHKYQLEILLEEREQEATSIALRIEDLENQLSKEQDDCKRITSKTRKFIKTYNAYLQAQEELNRAQTQLQKLGEQFVLDNVKNGANEEDLMVNMVCESEQHGMKQTTSHELRNHTPLSKKRPWISQEGSVEKKSAKSRREGLVVGNSKIDNNIRRNEINPGSRNNTREAEPIYRVSVKNNAKYLINEEKQKLGKSRSSSGELEKVKSTDMGNILPSTGMAAHAEDELIEALEAENSKAKEDIPTCEKAHTPSLPPLVVITSKNYTQYAGIDEDVDIEMVLDDNSGGAEVDKVDIEQ